MKQKEKRKEVLTLITAAMAIAVQLSDIELSGEIIQDASKKYGKMFVEDILAEVITAELVQDTDTIPKDVLINRAFLSLVRPLPASWMQTRN